MRFRLVTVAILLVAASGGHGRPRVPDPLDGNSSSQEALAVNHGGGGGGAPDSRYMIRMTRHLASASPTHSRRRNISITSVKYGSGSLRSSWQGRSILPGLSFDGERKNYLPLGALSSASSRGNGGLKFTGRSAQHRSYSPVPYVPTARVSTPRPIPISIQRKSNLLPRASTPIPIPVLSPTNVNTMRVNGMPREQRKIETSRNIVRILPQKVKSGLVRYKNSTFIKARPQVVNMEVKNWPNEALQNVEDLFNYEKYTSFLDEDIKDKNTEMMKEPMKPIRREPSIKSPEIQEPVRWSKIPVVEATSLTPLTILSDNDYGVVDTSMQIDNLLGDLETHPTNLQHQASSQVAQNTIVHILNTGSRKPNVTVVEPVNKVNRNKTGSTRPPQNVHIMFMTDKDEAGNQTTQLPPQVLGNDSDCPTIMINSITQINNTIESKEGCTDLNIVINSHVLNTNVFKPTAGTHVAPASSPETFKDPYSKPPVSNYYNVPSNNYGDDKDPAGEIQSDDGEAVQPAPEISTFEVFQGTHINVGGATTGLAADDVPADSEGTSGEGNGIDDTPLNEATEAANDIDGTNPQANPSDDVLLDNNADPVADVGQSTGNAGGPADVGTAQANDAPGAISLPSLPNIPNIPNIPGALNNIANLGTGNSGSSGLGGGGQTGLATTAVLDDDDDDDDFDLLDALSPDALLDGVSSVFTYFNVLNPINYGIFGMAVAPFVAFAAGILGVAAFIFPYAFPGAFDIARSWKGDSSSTRFKIDTKLRDLVQSSIHKYRHINEWKGRRRKRKRKR